MEATTLTLAEFVRRTGITLDIIEGPDHQRDDHGWEHNAYVLRLTMDGQSIDSPWRQGLGITDDPTAEALLDAMASDSASVDNAQSFEDWADELGFDTDSRKAEATYRECEAQRAKLAQWLGAALYDGLLYGTERL